MKKSQHFLNIQARIPLLKIMNFDFPLNASIGRLLTIPVVSKWWLKVFFFVSNWTKSSLWLICRDTNRLTSQAPLDVTEKLPRCSKTLLFSGSRHESVFCLLSCVRQVYFCWLACWLNWQTSYFLILPRNTRQWHLCAQTSAERNGVSSFLTSQILQLSRQTQEMLK